MELTKNSFFHRLAGTHLWIQLKTLVVLCCSLTIAIAGNAQGNATVTARMDARKIIVGDQVRLFLEVKNNPSTGRVEWASIPDTFNSLEIVERGKIDTLKGAGLVTYKQRLVITGFDSGVFKVPPFVFPVVPLSDTPYTVQSDSFEILVQTVAVDTTKAFKPIKGVMAVDLNWVDYIWYIIGGIVLLGLLVAVIVYLLKRKKLILPVPEGPKETMHEQYTRLLAELDNKQLWQKKQVKEYYVELTDIVRNYIEARFNTPALELTTDELLYTAQTHRELQPYHDLLASILTTADLAKFAKAQPLPHEHTDAMEKAKDLVTKSKPVIVPPTTDKTA